MTVFEKMTEYNIKILSILSNGFCYFLLKPIFKSKYIGKVLINQKLDKLMQ